MPKLSKVGEVNQITVTAHPSNKDNFTDPLVQLVNLPGTFLPGDSCQLSYACLKCRQDINFSTEYDSFIIGKLWSLKRLVNQRELFDQIGQLLNLKLEIPTRNGLEITRYYTAKLDIATVGYYRCPHCGTQYLIGYAQHGTDNEGRGIPESDTMHVQCIAQVELDEPAFLQALTKPA